MFRILFIYLFFFSSIAYGWHDRVFDDNFKHDKDISPWKYLKLTLTVDDLAKHGFDKDQVSYIKGNIGCKETGLTLITKIGKDIIYKQNYPQCWVFKQPFKELKEEKDVWFLMRYSDHEYIQLYTLEVSTSPIVDFSTPDVSIRDLYPERKISWSGKDKKVITYFGALNIYFINKCSHKWMNYSVAFETSGPMGGWKGFKLYTLDSLINDTFKFGKAQSYIDFYAEIPRTDMNDRNTISIPWFRPTGLQNNLDNDNYCSEVYKIQLKPVYYEK